MGMAMAAEMKWNEFNQLAKLVYEHSGIHLEAHKLELLQARLRKRLKALSMGSFKEYYQYVVSDGSGEELGRMLDHVTTNKTDFFREDKHFTLLSQKYLPSLISAADKRPDRTLRFWSAACSTGEEAYTLGMCALEAVLGTNVKVKVLATDLSSRVIEKAQAGLYLEDRVAPVPAAFRQKYFSEKSHQGEMHFEVEPALRQVVHFRRFNLKVESFHFTNPFDVIFCRNVMIYFNREAQEVVVRNLAGALRKDGYFFTGLSESLLAISHPFKSVASSVYVKP